MGSPIAIDLDGDGVETISLQDSNVKFDIDGDGIKEKTGWLKGDDGFVAFDQNNNGLIDGVGELFGGLNRGDGYSKLAQFDSNHDEVINSNDEKYNDLLVWRDINENGVSEANELASLVEMNVQEISVKYEVVDIIQNGNLIGEVSDAIIDGVSVEVADIYFQYHDNRPAEFFEFFNLV